MANIDSHPGLVVLIPHLYHLREFGGGIRDVEPPRANSAGYEM